MDANIPTTEEIVIALGPLGYAQMQELARLSGVAFTTLWKIKIGETKDPGVGKVRRFWPYVATAKNWSPQPRLVAPDTSAEHAGGHVERRTDTRTAERVPAILDRRHDLREAKLRREA